MAIVHTFTTTITSTTIITATTTSIIAMIYIVTFVHATCCMVAILV